MRTIWKFEQDLGDDVEFAMPVGAEVIHVDVVSDAPLGGRVQVWAIVDPNAALETRRFHVRGTGHPLREVGLHLRSMKDGPFVWHVFEEAGS